MKTEINFYEVDESIVKGLAVILIKIINEQKKALIFCKTETQMQELDKQLWSYGRSKFIPHITINDQGFDLIRQPILITNQAVNSNQADYLIFLDEVEIEFLNKFKRAFYFFENHPNISNVKPDNSFKKENGKWLKIN